MVELFLVSLSVGIWAGWIVWQAPEDRHDWTRVQRAALVVTWGILLAACLVCWSYVVIWTGIF